jgi:y4mF family transcriptional regulator
MKKAVIESPLVIARFVKGRRAAHGFSQRELGELAGVGTRLICDLERGKVTIRLDAVNRVLSVFGQMLGPVAAPRDEGDEQ